ncbi:MAG: hypothetical protein ACI92E_001835 [Oceanicoccus sp.]|jgi:hypothetical protein
MELLGINIMGVLAATVIGMVLGALWYSPVLFGKKWMQSIGKTPDTLGGSALPMVGCVIASMMTAVGISIVFSLVGVDSFSAGLGVGLTLGLLIVFPALLSDNLFCGWGN